MVYSMYKPLSGEYHFCPSNSIMYCRRGGGVKYNRVGILVVMLEGGPFTPPRRPLSAPSAPRKKLPLRGKYMLLDFADPLAHVAACRLRQLGATVLDQVPDNYPNTGFQIACFIKPYNSTTSNTTSTSTSSGGGVPRGASKRSRMLVQHAASSSSYVVDTHRIEEEQELENIAKLHGIKAVDFKQINNLLRKCGEAPIDLDFQSSSSNNRKITSPTYSLQYNQNSTTKKMRIYDENHLYLPLEKVYNTPARFAIDEPIPLLPPGTALKKEKVENSINNETGTGTQLYSKTSQYVMHPKVKTKESGFCEVCNAKFSSLAQHIESDTHNLLQENSPVWKIIDEIYAESENLRQLALEAQIEIPSNEYFKQYLSAHIHELQNMPMVFNFTSRILSPNEEGDGFEVFREKEGAL